MVEKIIDAQVAEGYFRQCPITFRDIEDAKKVLTDSLKTIYHTRIAYPELKQGETPEPRPHTTLFGTGLHRTWRKQGNLFTRLLVYSSTRLLVYSSTRLLVYSSTCLLIKPIHPI